METRDLFVNILVAILILFVTYYFLNSIGLTNYNNYDVCNTQSLIKSPTGETTQNIEIYTKCMEEEDKKLKVLYLKRSLIMGTIGLTLLLNKYYFPKMESDLSIGFGLSGLLLILMAISQFFTYIPEFVKFIISAVLLVFILKVYTDSTTTKKVDSDVKVSQSSSVESTTVSGKKKSDKGKK